MANIFVCWKDTGGVITPQETDLRFISAEQFYTVLCSKSRITQGDLNRITRHFLLFWETSDNPFINKQSPLWGSHSYLTALLIINHLLSIKKNSEFELIDYRTHSEIKLIPLPCKSMIIFHFSQFLTSFSPLNSMPNTQEA